MTSKWPQYACPDHKHNKQVGSDGQVFPLLNNNNNYPLTEILTDIHILGALGLIPPGGLVVVDDVVMHVVLFA